MKLLPILAFIIVVGFSPIVSAHTTHGCSRALAYDAKSNIPWPDYPKRPFDVLKYNLTLDWRKMFETKTATFSAVNLITVKITQPTDSIELDASYMRIDSLRINGSLILPTPQINSEKLFIPIPQSLKAVGTELTMSISYTRDTTNERGIYFYPAGTIGDKNTQSQIPEDIAFTMSEPTDARYWMPCMDLPYDKAESEISIIAPNGIETASNGSLLSKLSYTPSSTIWHWKSDEPITTYLMVADASNFVHWSQTHNRSAVAGDTVHLDYYAWAKDYGQDSITDGSRYNATYFVSRLTSQIMSWLEARYGDFPFTKYGQVPAQPFYWGGMEHQSCTTINRAWMRGDSYTGIAHEMAHQWFGDKTTCETFKDIWLNEGFASYAEALFRELREGTGAYSDVIANKAYNYFHGANSFPTYDPPVDNVFNYATTYCKGACVLHMLRNMLKNDSVFFHGLKSYSNYFAYTTADTHQFTEYMGQQVGLDLTEFIDEWIFTPLYPIYDIKWAQNANGRLYVQINQLQDIREHFTMPIQFFAYHGNKVDTIIFDNNLRSQLFWESVNYNIDSLLFDEGANPLAQYITASSDTVNYNDIIHTRQLAYAPSLSVRPSQILQGTLNVFTEANSIVCRIRMPSVKGTVELFNSLGTKLQAIECSGSDDLVRFPSSALASGMYIVRLLSENRSETRTITLVK
ncbi:MAG: M1 family aminopeptidase [bacterium]